MSVRGGASRGQPRWRRFRGRHRIAVRAALRRLRERPLAHLFALGLLALALFALLLLKLGADQFQRLGSPLGGARSLSLFLAHSIDEAGARSLTAELSADPRVAVVQPISPAEGLAELTGLGGAEDALAALPENPLPWVLSVEPAGRQAGTELAAEWRQRAQVEYLADEHDWQRRADAILAVADTLAWVLALAIGLAAILLAANAVRTIRVEGAPERALQRVFGAAESDLRRPYLYLGLLYGLLAGTLAVVLVVLVLLALLPALHAAVDAFGGTSPRLGGAVAWLAASIPVAGALGAVGGWLGCRFEHDLEPVE